MRCALELHRKSGAKFIDCMISSIQGIRNGVISVVSYDRDFDKLGVKRFEPGENLSQACMDDAG